MWILDDKPTKSNKYYVQQYNECTNYSLSDVYKSCSSTKWSIWNDYINKYKDIVAGSWKCVSANCFTFTMAAVIKENEEHYLLRISKGSILKIKVKRY